MNAYTKLLRVHPLFASLSTRALNRLLANATSQEYAKGSVVVRERDPGDALFVVISGRCQSIAMLPDGTEQLIDVFVPGDTFGERPLLARDRHWTTIRVITDCVLLRIAASDVLHAIEQNSRLEKELDRRVHRQIRGLRQKRDPERLGRVAAFAAVSTSARGSIVAHNTAWAVRQQTGRTVLVVELVKGAGKPSLSDWRHAHELSADELRHMSQVRQEDSGLWELTLQVDGREDESTCVATLLSVLARHVRYVLVHAGPDVPGRVVQEVLIQSDLPYVLLTQRPDDIYRSNLLVRHFRDHPAAGLSQPIPMVILEHDEHAQPYESLDRQIGVSVHGFIHGLSQASDDTKGHYHSSPGGRFNAHIRHLANEIGRRRIGLALSAGGAKSLAHIGVIQVLEENNIDVDVIAGTSMGALCGALWAHGVDGKAMEQLARRNESPWGLWKLIDPVFPPRRGFIRGNQVRRVVQSVIGDAHFSDLERQLRVVATNLETLERVVFDSGEVAPVVHASMAMPGIVVPVDLNGQTLVDGGVADPLPVGVLMEMGVERIIAVNTIPSPDELRSCAIVRREVPPRRRSPISHWFNQQVNYFATGNVLDIWAKSMLGSGTRMAEGACKQADVVLRPVSCDGRWHDFGHPSRYIELGRQVAEAQLDTIKALVK
ncbi:MAG: patatin-like phospholipase family protein [Verrucomicrobia bacterium]|nr:patatin-like phospholipase family protein [Verrucomicrobiota bacterium]